ncbi:MAG: BON domain-containing protein [Candidatus Binatia bacterium]
MIARVLAVTLAAASLAAGDVGALRRHLDAEVARHERALADARVEVAIDGDAVLLRGTVRLYRQKMLYEQIAWRAPGVREVENEVQVVPLLPATDAEIERQIVGLAKLARFQGVGLQATVRDGRVAVSGTFHDPADVFFLKHRLAEIEGVRDIAIAASFAV